MSLGRAIGTMATVGLLLITYLSSSVSLPEESLKGHSQELPGQSLGHTLRDPIRIYGNSDFTAANGVTSGSGTSSDPYLIEGWEIAPPGFSYGIVVQDTDAHFVIRDVYVWSGDIELTGILLDNASNAVVTDSLVWGFGGCIGYRYGSGIVISNNEIHGAWHWATGGGSVDNLTFTGNNVSARAGTVSIGAVTNSSFTSNIFRGSFEGVEVWDSDNLSFISNIFQDTFEGLALSNSTNIKVHHNTFFDLNWTNYLAIDDMGPENSWDDGYPSGGNYWGDYTGVDNMSGPNQDIPGSDGIGDTPYIIDADSQDRYPLMSPTVPPGRPPWSINAVLVGPAASDVRISWSLSPDDGAGFNTIVAYELWRGTSIDFDGMGYQLIATIPNGTSEFTDISAGEGDPSNYFYRICAIDQDSRSACLLNQAGKYTRPLTKGIHLVSSPFTFYNADILEILQTVKFEDAWAVPYSPSGWLHHSASKPHQDYIELDYYDAIWVNVTEDSNFTVAGKVYWASTAIFVRPGWRLIGFPSFSTTYTVADLKASISVSSVEGFDPSSPPYYLRELSDGDTLESGYGYWIYFDATDDWKVPKT